MTPELLRLIVAQICLHATMTGMRLAAPLLALRQGYSPATGIALQRHMGRAASHAAQLMVLGLALGAVQPMLFGAAGALIGVAGVFWVVGGVVATGPRQLKACKTA